jgi:ubiquinone/menaquinone biosynthesis C-methylase UbiE
VTQHTPAHNTPTHTRIMSDLERQRFRLMAQKAVASESQLWAAAGIVPGAQVVDIGCGPGAVLVEMARIVAPGGEAIGVEPDRRARNAADDEIATTGVTCARVIDGTAIATGLPADNFDVVMVRHVLHHLGSAVPDAVAHAASLLRCGGCVYLVDTPADLIREGTAGFDPDAVDFGEAYVAFQRQRGSDVTVGLRLGQLITDAGLDVVSEVTTDSVVPGHLLASHGPMLEAIPAMLAAGAATEVDVARWRAGLARTAAAPGVTLSVRQFIAVGRRPPLM